MQTHALSDAGFAIPPCPAVARRAEPVVRRQGAGTRLGAARRWLAGLGPLHEASLVGIVSLLVFWGLAELALILQGL